MEKGGEDGSADYKACSACTRVCQTTHGNGLSYSVPRFHKAVPDYSMPARRNCYMQIPAAYVRQHIGKGAKQSYVLEGVNGCEWEVTFNNIGLSGGWKTFAIDYRLEKGDQVMFGLVASNRFFVNVFDKFGIEKVSTRETRNRRGLRGAVANKEIDHLLPQNEDHQVSNSTSEGAEGFHTPLQVEHGKRCGEQKSNGVHESPEGTTSPHHNAQFLNSNGVCVDSTTPVASGQNGNHEGVRGGGASGSKLQDDSPQVGPRSLDRVLEFDPTRALIDKLLIREPVDCDELEPSGTSDSMSESEDSVQVLLAKAVLAKMRRKKLKKRKSSFTTNQVEMVTEAVRSGGILRTEVTAPSLNEDKAGNVKSGNGDGTNKILASLGTDGVTDSLEDDENGARGGTELEKAMHDKSCEGSRGRVDGSNGQVESQMCTIQAEPCQGAGDSNGNELEEHQNTDNGVGMEVVQDSPQPDHRENDAMAMDTRMETANIVDGEDFVLMRAGDLSNLPSPVFQATLVKEEPDLRNALGPEMTAAGNHNETCASCGLATIPDQDQISTPPTNLTCEIPRTRAPSSNAPSPPRESVRATEDQKQTAQTAKTFSANGPDNLTIRTPSSNGPSRLKGNGRVTEDQKQKALEVAKTFSANTKNPSAVVVMRISFVEKNCACFVSVKCAEMLPRAPTELILVDSEGYLRKANWRPERRYMQGSGWKDFVDSNNLQVNDVCVMEVIDNSPQQFKVLIHIFHAHEMDTSKDKQKEKEREKEEPEKGMVEIQQEKQIQEKGEQRPAIFTAPSDVAEASPGARTRHQEKRSQGASQLYGPLPSKCRKKRKKLPTNGAVETELPTMPVSTEDEITESEVQLTILSTEEGAGNPRPEPSMEQEGHGSREDRTPIGSSHEKYSASKCERKKVRPLSPLTGPKEPVQTVRVGKSNQSRKQYSVAKLVDRRKSLHGVVFLVELKEMVTQSSGQKKVKAKQDEKGRWWVPHSHFTSDFSSCYIE